MPFRSRVPKVRSQRRSLRRQGQGAGAEACERNDQAAAQLPSCTRSEGRASSAETCEFDYKACKRLSKVRPRAKDRKRDAKAPTVEASSRASPPSPRQTGAEEVRRRRRTAESFKGQDDGGERQARVKKSRRGCADRVPLLKRPAVGPCTEPREPSIDVLVGMMSMPSRAGAEAHHGLVESLRRFEWMRWPRPRTPPHSPWHLAASSRASSTLWPILPQRFRAMSRPGARGRSRP